MDVSSESKYERAKRLANNSLYAIEIQCHRLQDGTTGFHKWIDFDFLIVALTRLRRAATLAASVKKIEQLICIAIKEFDEALPGLKIMRNVSEHIDDYSQDKGRDPSIQPQSLEVSSLSMDCLTLDYLGHKLNALESLEASKKLFSTIKQSSEILLNNEKEYEC